MAKIFVAVGNEELPVVMQALDGYEIVTAKNLEHGHRLFCENQFDFYLIDILFDDSRAVELLRVLHKCAKAKQSPVLMVRLMVSAHTEMLRGLMALMQSKDTFQEYFEGDLAEQELPAKIRNSVEKLLEPEKMLPQ